MPAPDTPRGQPPGNGASRSEVIPKKQGKAASRGKRLRATATVGDPELFSEEEREGYTRRSDAASLSPETAGLLGGVESAPGDAGQGVSKQALKFVVGILLLPIAFILSGGFLGTLKKSVQGGLLAEQSFGCLAAGLVLFAILFFVAPRRILMLAYVFGHEVTHAVWVKLFGGKVADRFHVSLEGGHVLTDRVNTWIILSPYFFPIYSILAGTLYGVLLLAGWLLDLTQQGGRLYPAITSFQWLFLLIIGCTLAFHLCFTFLLVTKSQPDLHYGGTFFSLTMIYLINLLLVTLLLLMTSQRGHWIDYGRSLETSSEIFIQLCGQLWIWGVEGVEALQKAI